MKLVLFTPARKESAIGACSALITKELRSQGHDVTVVRSEAEHSLETETHDFGPAPLAWVKSEQVLSAVKDSDGVIYQIGDNHDFHKGCVQWLSRLPGIVILHDFFLGHLFSGWASGQRAHAQEILRQWYGEDAAASYFHHPNTEEFIAGTRDTAPMTEWICSQGHAVITHSSWGCDRVLRSCPGPVRVVPLAYKSGVIPAVATAPKIESGKKNFKILTIGHVNANKRVESVIRAISRSSTLRAHATYRLVGPILPRVERELANLAEDCGVKLEISGEVPAAVLQAAIDDCDVISCLRWPSLEAASASLIEALLCGKPTIVTETGCYQDVPSNCVLKVNSETEVADIQSALERLYGDVDLRRRIASEGQQWAAKTYTAANYTNGLITTVEETLAARPALGAVEFFTNTLAQWNASEALLVHEDLIGPLRIFEKRTDRSAGK